MRRARCRTLQRKPAAAVLTLPPCRCSSRHVLPLRAANVAAPAADVVAEATALPRHGKMLSAPAAQWLDDILSPHAQRSSLI